MNVQGKRCIRGFNEMYLSYILLTHVAFKLGTRNRFEIFNKLPLRTSCENPELKLIDAIDEYGTGLSFMCLMFGEIRFSGETGRVHT